MPDTNDELNLSQLGSHTETPASPQKAILECVPNPHPGTHYLARFAVPEFTSLCPVTGQPDFAPRDEGVDRASSAPHDDGSGGAERYRATRSDSRIPGRG